MKTQNIFCVVLLLAVLCIYCTSPVLAGSGPYYKHRPGNVLSADQALDDRTENTAASLYIAGLLLFIGWFPLSIYRMKGWKIGYLIKLALLFISLAILFFNASFIMAYFEFDFLVFLVLISPILLNFDVLIFTLMLFFGNSHMKKLAKKTSVLISKMPGIDQEKKISIFTDAYNHYYRFAGIMAIASALAVLPVIPWIFFGRLNFEKTLVFLVYATVFFIGGAVTGTIRFLGNVEAANSTSETHYELKARTLLAITFFMAPLLRCLEALGQVSLTSWTIAVWPFLILTSFYGGRSLAIVSFCKKFLILLRKPVAQVSITPSENSPLNKEVRPSGLSAHPGRGMSKKN